MTQTERIRSELQKASSLLSTADYLTKRGRLVSIAALGDIVSNICREVADAGYDNCRPLKPQMSELVERLEAYGGELERRFGGLETDAADGE